MRSNDQFESLNKPRLADLFAQSEVGDRPGRLQREDVAAVARHLAKVLRHDGRVQLMRISFICLHLSASAFLPVRRKQAQQGARFFLDVGHHGRTGGPAAPSKHRLDAKPHVLEPG